MQAVGQCCVCAAGAVLRHQNKNILRRACIRLLSGKPGVQKLEERTAARASVAPSAVDRGFYASPVSQQMENLSHDSLIRRSASVLTDGSSTFLSQTSLAVINALTQYSKAVHTRIAVQRRYLASLGKLTPAEKDSFLEVINAQRAEASERLSECKHFESNWINAVNLCKMAAEAAQTSGAEQASITVRTNLQVAQSQVAQAQKLSADAEKKLAETKVEEIQRMAEYTSSLEEGEEHEVHEAYLRED